LDIYELIDAGNFKAVDMAVSELLLAAQDASKQEEIVGKLNDIAEHYLETGGLDKASEIYQKILELAQMDQKEDAFWAQNITLINNILLDNISGVEVNMAIDELIANFPNHPALDETIIYLGEVYNRKGNFCDNTDVAKTYFEKAVGICERVIDSFPDSQIVPQAYYGAGLCYVMGEEYEKAINYFQKIIDKWPNSEYAGEAQYYIAECYGIQTFSGTIPQSVGFSILEKYYKMVVENYPNCKFTTEALHRLGEVNLEQGKITEAIKCFETAIEKDPNQLCRCGYKLITAYKKMDNSEDALRIQAKVEKNCADNR
jgi:tetratricopeptide (TPR) repeat protein